MVSHKRAPVKPRVVSPETHAVLLLEDEIEARVALGKDGVIELTGGPGAGKSTALAHLASLGFADQVFFLDDASPRDLQVHPPDRLVVYASRRSLKLADLCYQLAPWSRDEVIEYLLATQPACCSSVMARFSSDEDRGLLEGSPALWALVSEHMAAHGEIQDIRTALRQAIADQAGDEETLEDARYYAAALLLKQPDQAESRARKMIQRNVKRPFVRLLGFQIVQVLLTADRMLSLLKGKTEYPFPTYRLPLELIREVARQVCADPEALSRLRELFAAEEELYMPMVASILFAADPEWRPGSDLCLHLAGAYLSEAKWQAIDLQHVDLSEANLQKADVRFANLESSQLVRAGLQGLCGAGACLKNVCAFDADFTAADLNHADLSGGQFQRATFAGADLRCAVATRGAWFGNADFTGAKLRGAVLKNSHFRGACFEDADLHDVDLCGADLSELVLRTTQLDGANLEQAILYRCDLEFVQWPRARLRAADLTGGYLTGSCMAGADFRQALLNDTGLANIDWENADLRQADLRGCSFHMGSSRSGLVDSPYPCHGSRTGFYTDDYDDQTYKAPEEIRKANLCGADLRGAAINDVDFYLVDLRGAIYDRDQEAHFRRCGAILVSRGR